MFLSKKWIFCIIALTGVSLLFLLLIQFIWIRWSIENNRRHFDDRMIIASNDIRKAIVRDGWLQTDGSEGNIVPGRFFTSGPGTGGSVGSNRFPGALQQMVDSVLRTAHMPLSAGIIGRVGRACYLMSVIPAEQHSARFDQSAYKICLCTNTTPRALDIGFNVLPNEIRMGDSSSLVFPSVFTIVLLIGLFGYIIVVIERQKALSNIKNDFINNLTHEFNTPLFSIGLTSKMLLRSEPIGQSEKLREYVEIIGTEKERLQGQVDKILRLTAVESGSMLMEKERTDIHRLLEQSIIGYLPIITEKAGTIVLQPQAGRHFYYGDRVHLFNAFSNLIDNAIKYSAGAPSIVVVTRSTDQELVISFQDQGIGISRRDIKLIFNKFYRVKHGDRHDVKGFGIGLSYVREIVVLHKGTIEVRSEPGKGSLFIISLPFLT
jgi:signal transduction histidine kinase